MKKINNILAVSTFIFATQITQAHVTDDLTHVHENHTNRDALFQSFSPTDRMNFREETQNNMELMSTQERQTFMNNMNSGQGMGQGMGQGGMGQGGMGQGGMGQGMGQGGMGRGGMGQGGGGHGGR